jgi:hypothetical protein
MFLTQKRILKPNVGAVMVTYLPLPRADVVLKSSANASQTHLENGRSRRGWANGKPY